MRIISVWGQGALSIAKRTNFVRMFVDFFFVIPNVQVNALFPALEFCFVKTFGKINLWLLAVCCFSFSLSSKVHALYDCNRQTLSGNYTYCSPLFIISHGLMV